VFRDGFKVGSAGRFAICRKTRHSLAALDAGRLPADVCDVLEGWEGLPWHQGKLPLRIVDHRRHRPFFRLVWGTPDDSVAAAWLSRCLTTSLQRTPTQEEVLAAESELLRSTIPVVTAVDAAILPFRAVLRQTRSLLPRSGWHGISRSGRHERTLSLRPRPTSAVGPHRSIPPAMSAPICGGDAAAAAAAAVLRAGGPLPVGCHPPHLAPRTQVDQRAAAWLGLPAQPQSARSFPKSLARLPPPRASPLAGASARATAGSVLRIVSFSDPLTHLYYFLYLYVKDNRYEACLRRGTSSDPANPKTMETLQRFRMPTFDGASSVVDQLKRLFHQEGKVCVEDQRQYHLHPTGPQAYPAAGSSPAPAGQGQPLRGGGVVMGKGSTQVPLHARGRSNLPPAHGAKPPQPQPQPSQQQQQHHHPLPHPHLASGGGATSHPATLSAGGHAPSAASGVGGGYGSRSGGMMGVGGREREMEEEDRKSKQRM
jgi:hypothetical protein